LYTYFHSGHFVGPLPRWYEEVTFIKNLPPTSPSWTVADYSTIVGDTLFAGGCGRFFEGTAQQMYHALYEVLAPLPKNTVSPSLSLWCDSCSIYYIDDRDLVEICMK